MHKKCFIQNPGYQVFIMFTGIYITESVYILMLNPEYNHIRDNGHNGDAWAVYVTTPVIFIMIVSRPYSFFFFCFKDSPGSLKKKTPEESSHILSPSSPSDLLRLKGPSEPQQRMAAVETDKELNDLLDFTAVRSLLKFACV